MKRIILSNSQRANVTGCAKYYDYRVNRRLRKAQTQDHFVKGTLYHLWMEVMLSTVYFEGFTVELGCVAAYNAIQHESPEHLDLIHSMGVETVFGMQETGFFDRYTLIDVEWPFRLGITNKSIRLLKDGETALNEFCGVIDGILYDSKTETYLPLEHKSTSEKEETWLNKYYYSWQPVGYLMALMVAGMNVTGDVLYSVSRSKIPPKPEVLKKSGKASTAKRDTTPSAILEFIEEHPELELDPVEYTEKVCLMHPYSWLAKRHVSEADLKEWHADTLLAFSEARRLARVETYVRHASFNCSKCTYKDLCFSPGDEQLFVDNFEELEDTTYPIEFHERMEERRRLENNDTEIN